MVLSEVCEALTFLLDNIYIRCGCKLCRQILGIPMGTNCAPLVADLFFCSVMRETSCCPFRRIINLMVLRLSILLLGILLNIDNNLFDSMVNHIYPSKLQLNKANESDTAVSFLDLHLSISDGFVKTKIYDKRDDFDFDIVIFFHF